MQLNRKFLNYLFYFQLRLFNLLQKSTNVQNLCHHVTSCRGKEMLCKLKIKLLYIIINIETSGFCVTGTKIRITLYSITKSSTGKYCSVAFIEMVTF